MMAFTLPYECRPCVRRISQQCLAFTGPVPMVVWKNGECPEYTEDPQVVEKSLDEKKRAKYRKWWDRQGGRG